MPSYQSSGTISNDVWTHVAITIDKETNFVRFYKDNVLINAVDASELNIVNNANNLLIGTNTSEYFKGSLDDVRVYDRVLSSGELQNIYNDKYAKNMILHYDFEKYDHANSVVYDESAYGNHGQLVNKETVNSDFTKEIGEYAISGTAFKAEVDQYIRIPVTATNNIQGSSLDHCTFSAWVKTSQLNSYEPILHKEGVFSFGLDYGHVKLQLGDGTKMLDLPAISLMDMSDMASMSSGEVVFKEDEVYTKKLYKGAYNGTTFTEVTVPNMSETDFVFKSFNGGEGRMFILMPDEKTLYCYTETTTASVLTPSGSSSAGSTSSFILCDVYNTFLENNNLKVKFVAGTYESSIIHTSDNKFYYLGKSVDVGYGVTTNVTTPTEIPYLNNFLANNTTVSVIQMKNIHRYATCILFKDLVTGKQFFKASGQLLNSYPTVDTEYNWTLVNTKIGWDDSTKKAAYDVVLFGTCDHYTWNVQLKNNTTGEMELYTLSNRVSTTVLTLLTNCMTYFNSLPDSTWQLSSVSFNNGNAMFVMIDVINTIYGTTELYQYQYNNATATRLSVNDIAEIANDKEYVKFGTWIQDTSSIMFCIRDPSLVGSYQSMDSMQAPAINLTDKRLAEVNFNQPNQLTQPNTLFEHTEGRNAGNMAMRINETQHLELDGQAFKNTNMNTMSFSAWIKPDSVVGEQPILSRFGDENIVRFSMNGTELTLDIINQKGPEIGDVTVTKTYNPNTDSFELGVEGYVADRTGGKVYVMATKDAYVNTEKVLADYAVANMTTVKSFTGKLERVYFKAPLITRYVDSHTSAVTHEIKSYTSFYVMIVAIDDNGLVSVYRVNNADITSSEGYDATLSLSNLRGGFVDDKVSVNFDVKSAYPVQVSAIAYSLDIGKAIYLDRITTLSDSSLGSTTTLSYTTDKVRLDTSTLYSTANVTRAYVYVDVYNPVSQQRLQSKLLVTNGAIADPDKPLAKVLKTEATPSGVKVDFSLYSAVSLINMYYVATFTSDISALSDSDIVAKILAVASNSNAVSKKSSSTTINPNRVYLYNVNLSSGIASDGSLVALDQSNQSTWDVRVVAIDALGNTSVSAKFGGVPYDTGDKLFNAVYGVGVNANKQLGDGTTTAQTSGSVQTFMNLNVRKIATGFDHTMVITTDNKLYGVGRNNYGQIGDGTTTNVTNPTLVLPYQEIEDVACGYDHTVVLTKDNKVFVMGRYNYGQLGLGVTTDTNFKYPVQIMPDHKVIKIACSSYTSYFVTDTYKAYACGYNNVGQLGDGTTGNKNVPTQVKLGDEMVIDVVTTSHSGNAVYFRLIDNRLMACGYNGHGQLGDGTTTNVSTPKLVPISDVKKIACGEYHTILMKTNNEVYALGYNGNYQLATGNNTNATTPTRILADKDVEWIDCGYHTSIFGTSDKKLYVIGYNNNNQLGTGNTTNVTSLTELANVSGGIPANTIVYVTQNAYNHYAFFMTGLSPNMLIENVTMSVNPVTVSATITSGATDVEYTLLATSVDPSTLTSEEIRAMVITHQNALVKGTVSAYDRAFLTDIEIPKVIDAAGNVVNSSSVNACGVIVYLMNSYNGLSIESVYTAATSPLLKVNTFYYDYINTRYVLEGSVFSSTHPINSFFVTGFDFDTSAQTDEALRDFALVNTASSAMVSVTPVESVAQNIVYNFETTTNSLFNNIADATSLTTNVEATFNDFRILMNVAGYDFIGGVMPPEPIPSIQNYSPSSIPNIAYSVSDTNVETLTFENRSTVTNIIFNDFLLKNDEYIDFDVTNRYSYVYNYFQFGLTTSESLANGTYVAINYYLGGENGGGGNFGSSHGGDGQAVSYLFDQSRILYCRVSRFTNTIRFEIFADKERTTIRKMYGNSWDVWFYTPLTQTNSHTFGNNVSTFFVKIYGPRHGANEIGNAFVISDVVKFSNSLFTIYDIISPSSFGVSIKNYSPADTPNIAYEVSDKNEETLTFEYRTTATNLIMTDFVINNNEYVDFDIANRDELLWIHFRFGLTTSTNAALSDGLNYSAYYVMYGANGGAGMFEGSGGDAQANTSTSSYPGYLEKQSKTFYCRITRYSSTINFEIFADKERTTIRQMYYNAYGVWYFLALKATKTHTFGNNASKLYFNIPVTLGAYGENYVGNAQIISNVVRNGNLKEINYTPLDITKNIPVNSDMFPKVQSAVLNVDKYDVKTTVYSSLYNVSQLYVCGVRNISVDETNRDTLKEFILDNAATATDLIKTLSVTVNRSEVGYFDFQLTKLIDTTFDVNTTFDATTLNDGSPIYFFMVAKNEAGDVMNLSEGTELFEPEETVGGASSVPFVPSTVYRSIYAAGLNTDYQLGNFYDNTAIYTPTEVLNNYAVSSLACGTNFVVFSTQEGVAYGYGNNSQGQLGSGNTTNYYNIPNRIMDNVKQVACGVAHTMLLTSNGDVYACGDNTTYGQLGDGTTTDRTKPVLVMSDVKQVSCGDLHTVFLKNDGTVFACGYNGNGQLGINSTTNTYTPTQMTTPAGQTVLKVFAGYRNTYFITNLNEVYVTGLNANGQLGIDSVTQQNVAVKNIKLPADDIVIDIALGEKHALFLTEGKKVYACGDNATYGHLGDGTTVQRNAPVQVMADYEVNAIGCSQYSSYFHTTLGLYSVGYNNQGQLGDGTNTNRTQVVQAQLFAFSGYEDIEKVLSFVNSQYVFFCFKNQAFKISVGGKFNKGLEMDLEIRAYDKAIQWYAMATTTATTVTLESAKALVLENKDLGVSGSIPAFGTENLIGYALPKVYVENGVSTESFRVNPAQLIVYYTNEDGQEFLEVKQIGDRNPHAVVSKVSIVDSGIKVNGTAYASAGLTEVMVTVFQKALTSDKLNAGKQLMYNLRMNADPQVMYRKTFNETNRGKVISFENTIPFTYVFKSSLNGETVAFDESMMANYEVRVLMIDVIGVMGFNDSNFVPPSTSYYETAGVGLNTNNSLLLYNANATTNVLTKSADIQDISIGYQFSIFKDQLGDVYTIGLNSSGQLGNGTTTTSTVPVLVELPDDEIPDKFVCSYDSSYIISKSGLLYSTGYNHKGQLGIMNVTTKNSFTKALIDFKFKDIKAGHYHVVGITDDDIVMACGYNNFGQLGLGNVIDKDVFVPMKLSKKAKAIDCGDYFTAILTHENDVYMVGQGNYGSLGSGSVSHEYTPVKVNLSNITKVSCGRDHTIFLTKNGEVYATGRNDLGQLGDTTLVNKTSPIRVMSNHKVIDIFAINYTSFFITSDGTVYCTGYNNNGQLGLGNATNVTSPVPMLNAYDVTRITGSKFDNMNFVFRSSVNMMNLSLPQPFDEHPFVQTGFGDVYVSGLNNYRQLGDNTTTNQTKPIKVLEDKVIKKAAMADNCSFFLTVDGEVHVVGYGGNYRLGTNSTGNVTVPTQVLSSEVITDIDVSSTHTGFVTKDNKVYMCGTNTNAGLATLNTTAYSAPQLVMQNYKIRQVACGNLFTLFLTTDGKVYGAGKNSYGALGDGTTTNITTPKLVLTPEGKKIIEIACTYESSYFVTEDNLLYSCGYNNNGECGVNSVAVVTTPELVQGLDGKKIVGVRCGQNHVVALTDAGSVYVCGDNTYAQLGRLTPSSLKTFKSLNVHNKRVVSIECTQNSSYFVTNENEAYACGRDVYGELGDHYALSTPNRPDLHLVRCEGNPVVSVQGGISAQSVLFGTLASGLKASIGEDVVLEYVPETKELNVTTVLSASSEESYHYYLVAVTDHTKTLADIKTMTTVDDGTVVKGMIQNGVSNKQVISTLTKVDTTGNNYTLEGVNTARVFIYLTNNSKSDEHLKEVVWHREPDGIPLLTRWWRIEYQTTTEPITNGNYRSRILELGMLDEVTPNLPSTGSTIPKIYRTSNLKDIYVWTRLNKLTSTNTFTNESDSYLYEQENINSTFLGTQGAQIASIFDGSTSTSQQGLHGYDVISSQDPNGHIRFDYEFIEPTEALQIVYTDGNNSTNGNLGGITNMKIYKSKTGSKKDKDWVLHSSFVNLDNPEVVADPNTSANGWDLKYYPKGLKIIQYNKETEQWVYKGIYQV